MNSEERSALHKTCNELHKAVDNFSNELALLRNSLYVPAQASDYDVPQTLASRPLAREGE